MLHGGYIGIEQYIIRSHSVNPSSHCRLEDICFQVAGFKTIVESQTCIFLQLILDHILHKTSSLSKQLQESGLVLFKAAQLIAATRTELQTARSESAWVKIVKILDAAHKATSTN